MTVAPHYIFSRVEKINPAGIVFLIFFQLLQKIKIEHSMVLALQDLHNLKLKTTNLSFKRNPQHNFRILECFKKGDTELNSMNHVLHSLKI